MFSEIEANLRNRQFEIKVATCTPPKKKKKKRHIKN